MIDDKSQEVAAPLCDPSPKEQRQCHAVGAAGNPNSDSRSALERTEAGHGGGKSVGIERQGKGGHSEA